MSNRLTVGYSRVSTSSQAEEFDALEQQMARLNAYGVQEVLVDIESGRSDSRKEFNRLLQMVESGKVTKLVVTRIDRLGRSVITLHRTIALLEKHKVELVVLDAPIDINSPFGWFSLSQMSALAEFESRLMSSRIRHGMEYSRQQAKANSNAPFGYKRASDKLTPDGECWYIAGQCIDIYRKLGNLRASIAQIYEQYQVRWSLAGFRDWLNNPTIRGHTVYHRWHNHNNPSVWDVRPDTHEALISEQEWQEINYLLKRGRRLWGKNANKKTHDYPLAGQIVCGVCNMNCYRYIARNGKERMRCRKRDEGAHLCSNKQSVPLEDVEQSVIVALTQRAEAIATNASIPQKDIEPPELQELRSQLAGLERLGKNPAIKTATHALKVQIENLQHQMLTSTSIDSSQRELLLQTTSEDNFWSSLTGDEKREYFRALVERVVVRDGVVMDVILKL